LFYYDQIINYAIPKFITILVNLPASITVNLLQVSLEFRCYLLHSSINLVRMNILAHPYTPWFTCHRVTNITTILSIATVTVHSRVATYWHS